MAINLSNGNEKEVESIELEFYLDGAVPQNSLGDSLITEDDEF